MASDDDKKRWATVRRISETTLYSLEDADAALATMDNAGVLALPPELLGRVAQCLGTSSLTGAACFVAQVLQGDIPEVLGG